MVLASSSFTEMKAVRPLSVHSTLVEVPVLRAKKFSGREKNYCCLRKKAMLKIYYPQKLPQLFLGVRQKKCANNRHTVLQRADSLRRNGITKKGEKIEGTLKRHFFRIHTNTIVVQSGEESAKVFIIILRRLTRDEYIVEVGPAEG